MRLHRSISLFVILAAAAAFAADTRDYASIVAEMKQRVANAKESDRGKLLAELVRYQVELANQQFDAGKSSDAQATIADLKQNVTACRDAAINSGKDLKRTEIQLRQAESRLDDVRRELSFEDQPAVKEAVDLIDDARTAILDRMFGLKEKHK